MKQNKADSSASTQTYKDKIPRGRDLVFCIVINCPVDSFQVNLGNATLEVPTNTKRLKKKKSCNCREITKLLFPIGDTGIYLDVQEN